MGNSGTKIPRGIRVRRNKHGDTLQIDYIWRGKRYREALSIPPTATSKGLIG
jgi:hypothetical protein